jgi:hypothetical protein
VACALGNNEVSGGLRHIQLDPHHAISYTNTTTFLDNADLMQATW